MRRRSLTLLLLLAAALIAGPSLAEVLVEGKPKAGGGVELELPQRSSQPAPAQFGAEP
jgi:hypothetical protein